MSKAFTKIVTGTDLFQCSLINEILGALRERAGVLGLGDTSPVFFSDAMRWPVDVQPGDDVQAVQFWRQMQSLVEYLCCSYVNHLAGNTPGDFSDLSAFPLFTWESFKAVANLPLGWRRVVEYSPAGQPVWSYGLMEEGDIIDYWILEDLQRACCALRWTCSEIAEIAAFEDGRPLMQSEGTFTKPTVQEAIQDALDKWGILGWHGPTGAVFLACTRITRDLWEPPTWFSAVATRTRLKDIGVQIPSALLPCGVDYYVLPLAAEDGNLPPPQFFDIDRKGYAAGRLFFQQRLPPGPIDMWRWGIDDIGNITTCPLVLAQPPVGSAYSYALLAGSVFVWSFTTDRLP